MRRDITSTECSLFVLLSVCELANKEDARLRASPGGHTELPQWDGKLGYEAMRYTGMPQYFVCEKHLCFCKI